MSGAQGEADFNESVFDDAAAADKPADDKAPVAAVDQEPEEPKGDPASRLAEVAKKIGHAPKDQWKGDPADWLDAPEFILKAAGEVLPSMRLSLEKANDEIKGLKAAVKTSIDHLSKAEERAYAKAVTDIQARIDAAAAAGDVAGVREATDELVEKAKEVTAIAKPEAEAPEVLPEFAAWVSDNPWFGKDMPLTAAAEAIGLEAAAEGYTGKAQVKEVDRRLREQFPGKFAPPTNPNRNGAAAVEGLGSARRPAGKSFSDMPKEHQDMWADMNKLAPSITKESYAKEFFAAEKSA